MHLRVGMLVFHDNMQWQNIGRLVYNICDLLSYVSLHLFSLSTHALFDNTFWTLDI